MDDIFKMTSNDDADRWLKRFICKALWVCVCFPIDLLLLLCALNAGFERFNFLIFGSKIFYNWWFYWMTFKFLLSSLFCWNCALQEGGFMIFQINSTSNNSTVFFLLNVHILFQFSKSKDLFVCQERFAHSMLMW